MGVICPTVPYHTVLHLMAQANYAVVTSDKHGTILTVNAGALKMFGYAQNELVGKKVNILMPKPYSEQHDDYMTRYLQTKQPHVIGRSRVVQARTKDGTIVPVVLGISETETQRGTLFIAMFEKAVDTRVLINTDVKGIILSAKGNLALTLGYQPEEIVGKNISIICPAEIRPHHQKYMDDYHATQANAKVIGRVRNLKAAHKNGELINISLFVVEGQIEDFRTGSLVPGYCGVLTAVDNLEAIISLSKHGVVTSASSEFLALFGYEPHEVEGKSISRLVRGDLRDIIGVRLKNVQYPIVKTVTAVHKDSSLFEVDIELSRTNSTPQSAFIGKIFRTGTKKQEKEMIDDGEYMGVYTYGKILGSGFFGKVRMAYHRMTGEKVAIKTLRQKQYESVNMEYPPREVEVLKAIDHPYINRLYDTVVLDDRIHLILEFVSGKELCDIVEKGRLNEERARKYWRTILLGISYLHENGIVHRDIKLENVIVTDKFDEPKIIDMGFGNFILGENHMLRTFCGSPDYAAPELFLGKAYDGVKSDIWSLGVLLYTMLSASLPFRDSHAVLSGDFAFPSYFSSSVKSLLKRILVVDPDKRATMDEMMAHSWTNEGYMTEPTQPDCVYNTEIDRTILEQMQDLGMNPAAVRTCLQKKEYNLLTTTYHLLKKQKETPASESDTSDEHSTISDEGSSSSTIGKKRHKKDSCDLL